MQTNVRQLCPLLNCSSRLESCVHTELTVWEGEVQQRTDVLQDVIDQVRRAHWPVRALHVGVPEAEVVPTVTLQWLQKNHLPKKKGNMQCLQHVAWQESTSTSSWCSRTYKLIYSSWSILHRFWSCKRLHCAWSQLLCCFCCVSSKDAPFSFRFLCRPSC